MSIAFPPSQARSRTAGGRVEDTSGASGLDAGGTYSFQLALTNPLYDPIKVRLKVEPQVPPPSFTTTPASSPEKAKRPPFVVRLPKPESEIPVAAFAEAWEFEEDDDMFGGDDDELGLERERGGGSGKGKGIGVIERRANVTVVGGEVVIGKDAKGSIKVGAHLFD
jgi:dynactin-4